MGEGRETRCPRPPGAGLPGGQWLQSWAWTLRTFSAPAPACRDPPRILSALIPNEGYHQHMKDSHPLPQPCPITSTLALAEPQRKVEQGLPWLALLGKLQTEPRCCAQASAHLRDTLQEMPKATEHLLLVMMATWAQPGVPRSPVAG